MPHQTWKVFFACALGALIGSLIALQVNHNFWWVGLVAGFGVGYFTYEFPEVVAAVCRAWRRTVAWRPNNEWWAAYARASRAVMGFFLGIIGIIGSIASVVRFVVIHQIPSSDSVVAWMIVTLFFAVVVCAVVATEQTTRALQEIIEASRSVANPFRLWWTFLTVLLAGIARLVINSPRVLVSIIRMARVVGVFLKEFLGLIHSEVRLLCGVDAAIGATIGYFCGNAIVGAIAGGLLGVFNFEVLSIRVLHLVPETASLFHR